MDCEFQRGVRVMRRGGFTAVELLAVVGIVGVVLGMLLPALGRARVAGMSAVCASNARQLQLAVAAYAADHDGRYAPGSSDFRSNLTRWHGIRPHASLAFEPGGSALVAYMDGSAGVSGALRRCPSLAPMIAADRDQPASRTGAFERSAGGYGYNNAFVGTLRGRALVGGREVWRVVSDRAGSPEHLFTRPSETVAFADAAFPSARASAGVIEYSFVEPRFEPASGEGHRMDPSAHFRHAGRANLAYLDGHVGAEAMTFSWSSGLYRPGASSVGIGWPGTSDTNRGYGYR